VSGPEEVIWEAPPERAFKSVYTAGLEKVKASPGRWGRVTTKESRTSADSAAGNMRSRWGKKDPRWEVVVRPVPDTDTQQWGVWVRYRTDEQMSEGKTK